jgi:hypothetical protein
MIMKRGRLVLGLTLLLSSFSVPTFADDVAQRLESIVIDTFDDPAHRSITINGQEQTPIDRTWQVTTSSKFSAPGYPILKFVEGPGTYPDALFANVDPKTKLMSIGVATSFERKGYNDVVIYPTAADGKTPQYIELPGITKIIDLWVWGSNMKTSLDIHLLDYRGIPYVLHAGSLNFQGWKNIQVQVPSSVPQPITQISLNHLLRLTKLVVNIDPNERVDSMYVYIDQLKILTDMQQSPFDGKPLLNTDFINKYFSNTQKAGN